MVLWSGVVIHGPEEVIVLFASLPEDLSPHWLQRLHLIEAPEGTVLHSAELSLRGLLPWWAAVLFLLLGGALAFFLYFKETVRLAVSRRVVLGVLRTALIALVLVLLLRPVLLAEFHGYRQRSVVLLIDNTQSMTQADRRVSDRDHLRVAIAKDLVPPTSPIADLSPLEKLSASDLSDPTRLDLVKAVLNNPRLDLLASLRKKGPMHTFLFDQKLVGITLARPEDDWLANLKADGSRTALADAVNEVLVRLAGEPPAGIVIFTDGRDNASKLTLDEAARACRDKGVPLHIYGVGSSEAGILQIKDVKIPRTVFVDEKPEAVDDPVEVPVRFRCRGFKKGTIVLTVKLGDVVVTESFPVREGENLTRLIKVTPKKGKEGERNVQVSLRLSETPAVGDEVQRTVQVKTSRVKVLYLENTPRREYKFIQPVLDRDRRVLLRLCLVEGDPRLAEEPADQESGAMYIDKLPDNFPEPNPRDPDRRPYDLLILGDVPYKAIGEKGANHIRKFVKEGGGLVQIAGRNHAPAEYVNTPLAEVLPVDISRVEFSLTPAVPTTPFRPRLTVEGEQSGMMSLDDKADDNVKLWKEDLWKHATGFYWYYPVKDLKPGATALLVHPEKKTDRAFDQKPMPLAATHYYGKGEVLFLGVDETWRWRDNTGDRLTARFWGQVVAQLGLPHLLGNAKRTQLELERGEAVLGRVGSIKARLLDKEYEPIIRSLVRATLVNLDAADEAGRTRQVLLKRVPGQPGEYRGALPNDAPGRHELRVIEGEGLEAGTLPYRVDLPPRHEMEQAGLAEEVLCAAAATSGGALYREEDLYRLADGVTAKPAAFVQRQEVLLWNPMTLVLFVLLITAEWLLRKFSNLS